MIQIFDKAFYEMHTLSIVAAAMVITGLFIVLAGMFGNKTNN